MALTYELRVGNEPTAVNKLVKSGEFSNIINNPILQSVYFTPVKARYIEFRAPRVQGAEKVLGIAEVGVCK